MSRAAGGLVHNMCGGIGIVIVVAAIGQRTSRPAASPITKINLSEELQQVSAKIVTRDRYDVVEHLKAKRRALGYIADVPLQRRVLAFR